MRTRSYINMAAALSLALVAAGCGQQETREPQPVKVRTMKVEATATGGGQGFSGTVEESSGTVLSFSVAGTVKSIRVEAGQRVARGELIASLDEATLQSAYDAAAATLTQAEDAYRRMKQLHDNGSLPEIQWVEAQSKLRQAQSAESIARKSLADGRLYAPFAGVIAEKSVEVGHNVMPGVPVAKLVTVDKVKVCISVPENEIAAIGTGQAVSVSVQALGGRTFSGKITEKGIAANALSRSYDVKATVDNPQGELMPGMICTLYICKEADTAAIILPASIIQMDERNRTFVWTNDKGTARKRMVTVGRQEHNGVRITSGLAAGDEVITEGQQKVSEGMKLTQKPHPRPLSKREGRNMPRE